MARCSAINTWCADPPLAMPLVFFKGLCCICFKAKNRIKGNKCKIWEYSWLCNSFSHHFFQTAAILVLIFCLFRTCRWPLVFVSFQLYKEITDQSPCSGIEAEKDLIAKQIAVPISCPMFCDAHMSRQTKK